MNKNELTELARKAGFEVSEITGAIRSPSPLCGTELKRFAKLVAAAEREECAKVAAEPQVWAMPCRVGDASLGAVFHDYEVRA